MRFQRLKWTTGAGDGGWLKDTEVVRDLAEKAVTPVVEPAPVGGKS